MCESTKERSGSVWHGDPCGCSCSCQAVMTVEEEIQQLEDHRKFIQEQLGIIETKIAALKTVKES
jgi:hypothetical protein